MPLRDHFHPPLSPSRHWQGFHNAWASALAMELNRLLPEGYVAEPNVQFGIEIDVAALEGARAVGVTAPAAGSAHGRSREPALEWTPPAPTRTVPFTLTTDIVEVAVYSMVGGASLVGAIEIVSPANKDRLAHREAFVAKCRAYLQEGVGLIVVDVVTERAGDLHAGLLRAAGLETEKEGTLYAAAYRPVERHGSAQLEIWLEALDVGKSLPTLPLYLRGGPWLPVNLEGPYERVREGLRIP